MGSQSIDSTPSALLNTSMRDRMFAKVGDIGFAIALGKDGMSVAGHDVYRLFVSEPTTPMATVGEFYDAIQIATKDAALREHKPIKEQKADSRGTQVNKFQNFALMALLDNPSVASAYDYARDQSALGYNKLVKCMVAIKREVARNKDADEETLHQAVRDALTKEVLPLSEEVANFADKWSTMRYGDEKKGPSPYEGMLARMLATYPADYAEHVAAALQTVIDCAKKIESDMAQAASAAKLKALSE